MNKKKLLITGFYVDSYPRHKILISSLKEVFDAEEANYRGLGTLFFLKNIRKEIKDKDSIFILNSSYKFIFLVLYLKIFTNKKIFYDAFISFYDTFVIDRKRFSKFSLIACFIYLLDLIVCWSSDILIFDTEEHKKYFKSKFFISKNKRKVILPVSIDLSYLDNICLDNDLPEIFSKDKFNVFFYGTYIPLQGIGCIVEAAFILKDEENIVFTLLGSGQEKESILSLAKKYKLSNINFFDSVDYNKLIQYIEKADVCLGIFGDSNKSKRVIPNKVLECLAKRKIVITGRNLALERYFKDGEHLIYTDLANSESLASKILFVTNNYGKLSNLGNEGRKQVEDFFSDKYLINLIKENFYAK